MKLRTTILLLTVCTLLLASSAFAQLSPAGLSGTLNVPRDYATLAAAIADINAKGVAEGGLTISVAKDTPIAVPDGGFVVSADLTGANPVIIEVNGNTLVDAADPTVTVNAEVAFSALAEKNVSVMGLTEVPKAVEPAQAEEAVPVQEARQ
jgi:hypothetical protein